MTTMATHPDEVLGRQRVLDGQAEGHGVLILRKALLQQPVLVVQDELGVGVLHQDPEGLHEAVDLVL